MNSIKIKKSKIENKKNKDKQEAEQKDKQEAEEEDKQEAEQKDKQEAEQKDKQEAEQKDKQEAEEEDEEDEEEEDEEEEEEDEEYKDGEVLNFKILKKRGRKPKLKTSDELKIIELLKEKKLKKKEQKEINNNIKLEKKKEKEEKKEKQKEKNESDNNENGSMITKRRGRKPKDKFKYETNDNDEYGNIKTEENLIIKLPLSCLKLNNELNYSKNLFSYNPNLPEPKPYTLEDNTLKNNNNFEMINISNLNDDGDDNNDTDYNNNTTNDNNDNDNNDNDDNDDNDNDDNNDDNDDNNYDNNDDNNKIIKNNNYISNINENNLNNDYNIEKKNENTGLDISKNKRQIDIILNNKYNSSSNKLNVLTHLGVNLNNSNWITSTKIACLWCCHSFTNTPWGIPYKFINNKFQLFGNFCMSNCALAYLLQYYKYDDSFWEKISLLNLLYFKVYGEYKTIMPSIDKMALTTFGGTLTIDDYRNLNNEKTYNIQFPPCNTIIPMLEEIYKKSNLNNTFIPVDKSKINILNINELKLKRNKPIINHKNTLDFCLSK